MSSSNRCPVQTRLNVLAAALLVTLAGLPAHAPRAAVKNAEDLLIVDCLLPGQVRSLGRQATYLTARRPIRTTQSDCQIRGGEYVSEDRANYQTALKVWLDQAMAGSAEAQNNVGEIYSKGLGTAPDYGMAFQWFKKASDQGYNRAKINLGFLYEEGLGVPQDQAMALNLYREGSGIQDELLYASEVEIQLKAKDDTIGTLQGQVQDERERSQDLQQQVKQLQQQLAEKRSALQASQRQLQETEGKLAQAKQGQDRELVRLLENQVLAQQQQITGQRDQIVALERSGGSSGGSLMASAPVKLDILSPTFVAVRGRNTAVVRGSGKHRLVGRVSQPKAIKQVTVNGKPVDIAANGSFNAEIDVGETGSPVKVVAVDNRGASAQLDFSVIPQAGGASTSTTATAPSGSLPGDVKLGRYYAVVIGNNTYRNAGYQALKTAASDATAVSNILSSRYGFQTKLLLNASKLEILTALNEMREKVGPQDNLLIYYAGHGEIDATGKQGYWVPSDGSQGNSKSWISNSAVSDILNAAQAKHVLVVADSCYSGTMTRASAPSFDANSMPADKWTPWVKAMNNGRSRLALTSGGVMPVPDAGAGNHSFFAKAFLNVLQDNNKLVEAQRVFREVSTSVALSSTSSPLAQVPQYAPIRFAGHESGGFFFQPAKG